MRIFKNEDWEELSLEGNIIHFGYYRRYRFPDGSINPEFRADKISGLILDVKEKKERGLNYFYNEINQEICGGITICVVPSHNAGSHNDSGISVLAKRLASSEGRIDGTDYLLRNRDIPKLATGGDRSECVHRNSISINDNININGEVILLVDDVTTSGASLQVCKDILLENGASRVAMFALGQSI